jgi:hypothetical protein
VNKRQRNKKHARRVNHSDLAPLISEGFTQDASVDEAFEEAERKRPLSAVGAAGKIGHMLDVDKRLEQNRGGFASFVAMNDPKAVWTDGVTDRIQYDLHKNYTEGGMRLLSEGRQCLRCDEPLDPAFPISCPICHYAVADRQIMDIAMEFEGTLHLGPSRPISEYMEEQEARLEKRKFIRRVLDGGQGHVPKEWLTDKDLLEGLTPQERFAIGVRSA